MGRLRDIAEIVAEMHGVSFDDLRGQTRVRKVALARQEAYVLMRPYGSTTQIGRMLNRDHSTVVRMTQRYEARRCP